MSSYNTTLQLYNTRIESLLEKVNSLPDAGGTTNPVIESLSITANGTYTASDGVDGYSPVTVSVASDIEEWAMGNAYIEGEIVIYRGVYYICISDVSSGSITAPNEDSESWKKVNDLYKGEYSEDASYSTGDLVVCDGNLYEAKVDNPQSPPNNDMGSHWNKLTSNVTPSGTKTITTNGTYDVSGYASAEVNVASEDLEALGELCEYSWTNDASSNKVLYVYNRHPSYYMHFTLVDVISDDSTSYTVDPDSSTSMSFDDFPSVSSVEENEVFRIDEVRWTKNA